MIRRLNLRRADALIALAAVLSVSVYVVAGGAGGAGFPLDDGWIHQTYARNLAQRGEWAFVPGMPSAGSTAPLWTALLAVGYALGVDYALWTHGLGALCLALMGMLGMRVAERIFPELRKYHAGPLTGLAIVLEWHLVWAAASGMETALFGALSMAAALAALTPHPHALARSPSPTRVEGETRRRVCFWLPSLVTGREGETRRRVRFWPPSPLVGEGPGVRGLLLGFLGGLLTLTRPEGVGLVGLAVLASFAVRRVREWAAGAAGAAVGWLVGVAPGALLNLSLSGSVLPNTASAKQAEYAALLALPYPERLVNVAAPVTAGALFLVLPGIVWGLVTQGRRRWSRLILLGLPLLWGGALLALYALRLPVSYQHGRYVVPAIPHLMVWGVGGTLALLEAGRGRLWSRLLTRTLGATAALTLLVFWGMGVNIYATDVGIIQSEMVAAARYLADEIPPGDLLAVHDIGAVGYFAPRPILDLAGLVSPEVIPIIRDEAALLALMEARGAAYLMTFPAWYPAMVADARVQLVYQTEGTGPESGGENMAIYRLVWGGE